MRGGHPGPPLRRARGAKCLEARDLRLLPALLELEDEAVGGDGVDGVVAEVREEVGAPGGQAARHLAGGVDGPEVAPLRGHEGLPLALPDEPSGVLELPEDLARRALVAPHLARAD